MPATPTAVLRLACLIKVTERVLVHDSFRQRMSVFVDYEGPSWNDY